MRRGAPGRSNKGRTLRSLDVLHLCWLLGASSLSLLACENPSTEDASGGGFNASGGTSSGGSLGKESGGARSGDGGVGEGGVAGADGQEPDGHPYEWNLPKGLPLPPEPLDNPTTVEKVELGRHLFYDVRLSENETLSCASCHHQERAFTDGLSVSVGSTGELTDRNSMSLANVGYAATLTWANPLFLTLERQAIVPLFGESPVELGIREARDLEEKLGAIELYQELFHRAYPRASRRPTLDQVTRALAAFQRTLISSDAPYDRWIRGDEPNALSAAALEGYRLFHSEKFECFHCHVGFNLSDHVHYRDKPFFDAPFHNTGLYNLDGKGAYPAPNTGVHSVTLDPSDMGRFKAPTLRNIALTAPYMHDGSIATLEEVLEHYAAGGREIQTGPYAGRGSTSPMLDPLIRPFELSREERDQIIAFLHSLTDESFVTDPRFANPFEE